MSSRAYSIDCHVSLFLSHYILVNRTIKKNNECSTEALVYKTNLILAIHDYKDEFLKKNYSLH